METQALVWGWPIWLYLFLAGVAGGGFFAAFLVSLFSGGKHQDLLRIATWIGLPLVLIGVLLLVIDLGNQLWAWHLFVVFLPLSPMSLGSWILLLWSILAVALTALWFAELFEPEEAATGLFARVASWLRPLSPAAGVLAWIEFVLSVLLIAYTGVLLSSTSRELWSTILLPVLFVVSAISTGMAATLLVAVLLGREIPPRLGQAAAILEVYEAVALIAFLVAVPAGLLISGPLSLFFWIGVIGIGMLIPFVLELATWKTSPTALVLTMAFSVLFGGLVLRAVIVVGGQI
jgi:formate-dependent nitrite reductase membrane component NrfD